MKISYITEGKFGSFKKQGVSTSSDDADNNLENNTKYSAHTASIIQEINSWQVLEIFQNKESVKILYDEIRKLMQYVIEFCIDVDNDLRDFEHGRERAIIPSHPVPLYTKTQLPFRSYRFTGENDLKMTHRTFVELYTFYFLPLLNSYYCKDITFFFTISEPVNKDLISMLYKLSEKHAPKLQQGINNFKQNIKKSFPRIHISDTAVTPNIIIFPQETIYSTHFFGLTNNSVASYIKDLGCDLVDELIKSAENDDSNFIVDIIDYDKILWNKLIDRKPNIHESINNFIRSYSTYMSHLIDAMQEATSLSVKRSIIDDIKICRIDIIGLEDIKYWLEYAESDSENAMYSKRLGVSGIQYKYVKPLFDEKSLENSFRKAKGNSIINTCNNLNFKTYLPITEENIKNLSTIVNDYDKLLITYNSASTPNKNGIDNRKIVFLVYNKDSLELLFKHHDNIIKMCKNKNLKAELDIVGPESFSQILPSYCVLDDKRHDNFKKLNTELFGDKRIELEKFISGISGEKDKNSSSFVKELVTIGERVNRNDLNLNNNQRITTQCFKYKMYKVNYKNNKYIERNVDDIINVLLSRFIILKEIYNTEEKINVLHKIITTELLNVFKRIILIGDDLTQQKIPRVVDLTDQDSVLIMNLDDPANNVNKNIPFFYLTFEPLLIYNCRESLPDDWAVMFQDTNNRLDIKSRCLKIKCALNGNVGTPKKLFTNAKDDEILSYETFQRIKEKTFTLPIPV